jgi:predicted hydrocarbon binding protein
MDVLDRLSCDEGQGRIDLSGVRYMIVRPETFVELQRAMEEEVGHDRAGELVAAGGRAGGRASTRRFIVAAGLAGRAAAEAMAAMGPQIGWGHFLLESYQAEPGRLAVVVRGSPFAEAYGPSPRPVCHAIRGIVQGIAEAVFDGEARAREERCSACGAGDCRFVAERIGPPPSGGAAREVS